MINLKCTQKLAKFLGVKLCPESVKTDTTLGSWYANLVSTSVGDVVLFVNERSLLSVIVPAVEVSLVLVTFTQRVYQQLVMIGVSESAAKRELFSFNEIQLTKTTSRRILGTMNEISLTYQNLLEDVDYIDSSKLTLVESKANQFIYRPISYRHPSEVTVDLFANPADSEMFQ
jgi:hypothetical protein